jgi:hypothetical protein
VQGSSRRIRLTYIVREGRVPSHGAVLSSSASERMLIQDYKM